MKTFFGKILTNHQLVMVMSVKMDSGKYRHYQAGVGFVMAVSDKNETLNETFIRLTKNNMEKEFGEVELSVTEEAVFDVKSTSMTLDESLLEPKTVKALKQRKTPNLLCQFLKNLSNLPDFIALSPIYWKSEALFVRVYNGVIGKLNDLLLKIYRAEGVYKEFLNSEDWAGFASIEQKGRWFDSHYAEAVKGQFFFKHLLTSDSMIGTYPVMHLAVSFREKDMQKGLELLISDLNRMVKMGLVFGHHSMPEIMRLNNTVGNSKNIYVAFAGVIVNTDKLLDLFKLPHTTETYQRLPINPNALGEILLLDTLSHEGSSHHLNDEETFYADEIEKVVSLSKDDEKIADLSTETNEDVLELQRLVKENRERSRNPQGSNS